MFTKHLDVLYKRHVNNVLLIHLILTTTHWERKIILLWIYIHIQIWGGGGEIRPRGIITVVFPNNKKLNRNSKPPLVTPSRRTTHNSTSAQQHWLSFLLPQYLTRLTDTQCREFVMGVKGFLKKTKITLSLGPQNSTRYGGLFLYLLLLLYLCFLLWQ